MAEQVRSNEQSFDSEANQKALEAQLTGKSDQLVDRESAERAYDDINQQKAEAGTAGVKAGDLHRNRAAQLEQQADQMVAMADQWRPENPDLHIPQVEKADRIAKDLRRQASELKQRAVDLDLAPVINGPSIDKSDQLADPEAAKRAYDDISYENEYARIAKVQQERKEVGLDPAINSGSRLDLDTAQDVAGQIQEAGVSNLIDKRFESLQRADALRSKQSELEGENSRLRAGFAADKAKKQEAKAAGLGRDIDQKVREAEQNIANNS